ncbi:flavin monoamine oxidase family protein [Marinobacter alexandrii]|uniref:flavin monoamine oxidase family protein n=1 Tax=Marinobacter alexandrii TaxID=2570351 RepID=UPI0032980AAB
MAGKTTDIAIVGAGLSGLTTAERLLGQGFDVEIFEAKPRVGGRVHSLAGALSPELRYDLGPAWIWPHNTRMLQLIDDLGLSVMRQHSIGILIFQDQTGQIRRDLDFATMGDALRIPGGLAHLTETLAKRLPAEVLHLGHEVTAIDCGQNTPTVNGHADGAPWQIECDRIVLALPPRIAENLISFSPELELQTRQILAAVPTWMAGQAKLVATYDSAFWRTAGLSGDAISHVGPLFEVHDATATPEPEGEAALFGFIAPQEATRSGDRHNLVERCLCQLGDLFGPQAASPTQVHLQAWAEDQHVATDKDRADTGGHPSYRPIQLAGTPWANRLYFSGTETAPENGGFLEGALEAAEQVTDLIKANS